MPVLTSLDDLTAILEHAHSDGGQLVITDNNGEWLVSYTFGQEAPDSPMAAGASYAANGDLGRALAQVRGEVRI